VLWLTLDGSAALSTGKKNLYLNQYVTEAIDSDFPKISANSRSEQIYRSAIRLMLDFSYKLCHGFSHLQL